MMFPEGRRRATRQPECLGYSRWCPEVNFPGLWLSSGEYAVGSQTESKRSYCRICTTQCGILIDLEGDQIVKIRGDRDHPVSKGYTCPKGRAIGRLHHSPGAFTQPMLRRRDALVAVSWEECLDDLAAMLRSVIERHGPHAIGVFFGSGLGMDAAGFRMAEGFYRGWARRRDSRR